MRTIPLLALNSFICALAGAIAVIGFTFTTSLPLQVTCASLAALAAAAAFGWTARKFLISKRQIASVGESGVDLKSGVSDWDVLRTELAAKFYDLINGPQNAAQELDDIKNLLTKLDRRDYGNSKEGSSLTCAERLRGILQSYGTGIGSNVQQATSCGRELERVVEEIVSGAEFQFDLMNQATNVVEELSGQIMSVCDNAEHTLDTSNQLREKAQTGFERFKRVADEMKQVRNQAATRERKFQTLGQHAKEIESIVQTIGSLSSRTDLLALNASIESVRAGEHGRGFAVVAEEVRALAEQSAQAVLDISSRIEMMQLETQQSISVASSEHEQLTEVMDSITQTLNELGEIRETASQSADSLDGISDDSNKQLLLAQQLVAALEKGTDTSQKNRGRAEGAHWTAKTLGEVSEQLDGTLDLFRLSGAMPAEQTS